MSIVITHLCQIIILNKINENCSRKDDIQQSEQTRFAVFFLNVQGVIVKSGKCLNSKFGRKLKQTIHKQKVLNISFNFAP